jgi:hypothetical protein
LHFFWNKLYSYCHFCNRWILRAIYTVIDIQCVRIGPLLNNFKWVA